MMIRYWRNEENNELYKDARTLVGRCLTLKNIPHVLESWLKVHFANTSCLDFHPPGHQGT